MIQNVFVKGKKKIKYKLDFKVVRQARHQTDAVDET